MNISSESGCHPRIWLVLLTALLFAPFAGVAAPANVTVTIPQVTLDNNWLLDTDSANDTIRFGVTVGLSRNQPAAFARTIPVTFRTRLRVVGTTTSVGSADTTVNVLVPGVVAALPVAVNLEFDPTVVLSEDLNYEIVVSVLHNDDPPGGAIQTDHTVINGPHSFGHFDGSLSLGGLSGTMFSFSSAPVKLAADQSWRLFIQSGLLAGGAPFNSGAPATASIDVLRNDATGAATLTTGSVNVTPPPGPLNVNGWVVGLGPVLINSAGMFAQSFTLMLPPGTGWRLNDLNPATTEMLNPVFSSEGVVLNLGANFQPSGGATGAFNAPRQFVDERLAVGFSGTGWQWDLFHLRLPQPATRFFRAWYFDQWKDPGVKGELPDSNDGFWDRLNASASGDLLIAPGMTGGFNTTLTFANGVFSTHFPHGFVAHTGGSLQLVNSQPLSAQSSFPLATVTMITYRGCRPEDAPHTLPDPATREGFQVGPRPLRFTAQGSLWSEGLPVADPNPLDDFIITRRAASGTDPDTGLPVHQTDNYVANNIQILVPGPVVAAADGFDRTDDSNNTVDEPGEQPAEFNPARWLLTGLRPAAGDVLEHPGTTDYFAGAGDYAGANFRGFAGLHGISRVGGGQLGPYQLDTCQKLYARASGVSGRWVADAATLPPSVQVGGPDPFTMTINEWAFQLIGNQPQFEHSQVAGGLTLPYPADFSLAFDQIEFKCCGALDRMSLAGGEAVRQLAYWQQSRIAIQSARFVSAAACSMDDSGLELAVRARANGFPAELDGVLIFRGNGRMTTGKETALAASALHVPSASPFAGDYHIEPVRHAYYNDPPISPAADEGWINVAGMVALPYFEAMETHAQIHGIENPPFDPDVIPGMQGGWSANNQTYFSSIEFDNVHRGLPPAFDEPVPYLTSNNETYLPRAEKTWFGIIPFDFPVSYDALTRTFRSLEKKKINVIIAEADADVPRLNGREAAIEFGATFGLSLNNIFANALELATGEIMEGFGNLSVGAAFTDIDAGLDELDSLLSQQVDGALDVALSPIFDNAFIQAAANVLKTTQDTAGALEKIEFNLTLQSLIAEAVAGNVTDRLGPLGDGLQGMRAFLAPGEEAQVGGFMQQAMDFLNLPEGFDLLSVPELIQLAGIEAGPMRERLEELRSRMQELRELVQNVTGLDGELDGLLTGANVEFAGLQMDVQDSLEDYFETVSLDPGSFSVEEIEARIRAEVKARIYALPVMSQVQNVLRFRFYHLDHLVKQVLASALDQINEAITEAVAEVVDLDGTLGELTGVGNYLQAASLRGEAVITGQDLTYLSLRAHTVIHTQPIAIALDPFFEYQQLYSDGAAACDPALVPAMFNRITMGATVAPANVPFGNVNITLSTQFSFTDGGKLIGLKGNLETLTDGLSLQPVNFDRMSATLAVSANQGAANFEFYLAAEAEATLFGSSGPVQLPFSNYTMHGGLFVGRTCTNLPYAAWAPQLIQDQLTPPFIGVIASVNGKFPFYDVGCLLKVKAGAGVGAFGFLQSDPADYSNFNFGVGGFLRGEVSGEFLCLLSGSGAVELSGSATQDGASLLGKIETDLELGPCPFCIKVDSDFGVTLDTSSNPALSVDF